VHSDLAEHLAGDPSDLHRGVARDRVPGAQVRGRRRDSRRGWDDRQTVFGTRGAASTPASTAPAIEGYPMTTKNAILEELHVGTEGVFADAGFTEVSRPTLRRA